MIFLDFRMHSMIIKEDIVYTHVIFMKISVLEDMAFRGLMRLESARWFTECQSVEIEWDV